MGLAELEMVRPYNNMDRDTQVGGSSRVNDIIARGGCSYCGRRTAFRQVGEREESDEFGWMVAVRCDGCHAIQSISFDEPGGDLVQHPPPRIRGVEELPEGIDSYYQEALRCISVDAPNGAVTLFRKTIHSIALHYGIADVDDSMTIFDMIEALDDEGHINPKLREALLAVKDIGNDGAHINTNEPDVKQALAIKELIDATLESTVLTDHRIKLSRDAHPNEYADEEEDGSH